MQVKITQVVFPVCLSCMSEFDQMHISTDVKRVWISTQLPSSKHVPAVVHGQVCYATCTLIGYTNARCMDLSTASFTNAGSLCKENLAQCHMMCLHVKFSHWTHPYGYASESRTLTAEPQRRIQATEMRCYRKILCISYKDHVILIIGKRRKLQDFESNQTKQHWHGWNQFGTTRVFFSVPRYDWCTPLSHSSSCMLVNHGPSQQSSKEEDKLWKWGATARHYTSHIKTMLLTRKSVSRSSKQLDHTKTSWPS